MSSLIGLGMLGGSLLNQNFLICRQQSLYFLNDAGQAGLGIGLNKRATIIGARRGVTIATEAAKSNVRGIPLRNDRRQIRTHDGSLRSSRFEAERVIVRSVRAWSAERMTLRETHRTKRRRGASGRTH